MTVRDILLGAEYGSTPVSGPVDSIVIVGTNGTILSSSDGITWNQRVSGTTCTLRGAIWDGSKFIATGFIGVGSVRVLHSFDAVSWNVQSPTTFSGTASFIMNNSTIRIIGTTTTPSTGGYGISTDGVTWTGSALYSDRTNRQGGWQYFDNKFWSAGSYPDGTGDILAAFFSSPDGRNWGVQTMSTWRPGRAYFIHKCQLLSGAVYIRAWGAGADPNSGYYRSTDGINWVKLPYTYINSMLSPTPTGSTAFSPYAIVQCGTNSAGNGVTKTSSDGITYTDQVIGPEDLRHVVWTKKLFVACGDQGAIYTSPDGLVWTKRVSGTTETLYAIATL